jgi:hypothetical protein
MPSLGPWAEWEGAPEQVEPHHHRQHPGGDGGDVHVGAEPDEEQRPWPAMAFGFGNEIDASFFDLHGDYS